MMKIFLVEDEVFALEALQRKINDLNGPYQIVGVASNGAEALEALETTAPDVLMTDIRMPDMDGVALIERLREQKADILPVIISGYQEFEYAQRAVRLGVKDYLLKPVKISELKNCLEHCAEQLKRRRKRDNAVSFMIGDDRQSLKLFSDGRCFVVAYLVIANALSHVDNIIHPHVAYVPSAEIERLFAAHLPKEANISCFDGFFSNEKALICENLALDGARLLPLFQRAANELQRRTGEFVSLYFETADNPQTLGSRIRACRKSLVSSMALGVTQVYDKPLQGDVGDPRLKERAELFFMLLQQNQLPLLHANIRHMFDEYSAQKRPAMAVQNDLVYLLDSLRRKSPKQTLSNLSSAFYVENILCFSHDEKELAENFYQLLAEFLSPEMQPERGLSAEDFVSRIERLFQENLDQNFSLQELSDSMHVSKVYLCRVFKKHKNMTPMDYFNHLKLNRAKELLLQFPAMPLREIIEKIGFNDLYYFSKVFKRMAGVTPSDFRAQNK